MEKKEEKEWKEFDEKFVRVNHGIIDSTDTYLDANIEEIKHYITQNYIHKDTLDRLQEIRKQPLSR